MAECNKEETKILGGCRAPIADQIDPTKGGLLDIMEVTADRGEAEPTIGIPQTVTTQAITITVAVVTGTHTAGR